MATKRTPAGTIPSGVRTHHPDYDAHAIDWQTCSDCYRGERIIKEQGTLYLPPTTGMSLDGQGMAGTQGEKDYQAYKTRAVFPDTFRKGVEAFIGILHRKPAVYELPPKLEYMINKATVKGESLAMLHRKINAQQLIKGRIGLFLDLPNRAVRADELKPYIATYEAQSIINWDDGSRDQPVLQKLNLVVLDETEAVRADAFTWKSLERFRVLTLGPLETNDAAGVYKAGFYSGDKPVELSQPQVLNNSLDEIPFVFVNSKDVLPDPDDPPLIGLADMCLAIYRGEADHRHALHMHGQDTLVVKGGQEGVTYRLGGGAAINVSETGDANLIGPDGSGLSEMRHTLEDDKKIANLQAAQLIDTTSRQRESGEALRIRVAAQTATLHQIAWASAEGMKRILQIAAVWVGEDPSKVIVKPNLDFSGDEIDGKTLVDVMEAKHLGLPLDMESIHDLLRRRGMTNKEFEEEAANAEEERLNMPVGTGTSNADNGE